jgi:hypothetical protein
MPPLRNSQYVSECVCMCFMCNVGVKLWSVCEGVWTWCLCYESESSRLAEYEHGWQVSVQMQGSLVPTEMFYVRCLRLQWWLWSICQRCCVDLRVFRFGGSVVKVYWKCDNTSALYCKLAAHECCVLCDMQVCCLDASTSQLAVAMCLNAFGLGFA